MNVLTWTKRETMPQIGQFVYIDGKKGEVKYVGPNKSGADVVVIQYAGDKDTVATTLQSFLASLEVKQ